MNSRSTPGADEAPPGIKWTPLPSSLRLWSGESSGFTLTVLQSGASVWRVSGVERLTKTGGVRLKRPGDYFRTVSIEEASAMTVIELRRETLACFGPEEAERSFEATQIEHDEALSRALLAMGRDPAGASERLVEALVLLSQHTSGRATPPGRAGRRAELARVRAILAQYATEDLRIEALAREVDLHPVTLSRLFREEYGITPRAYLIERRVELAQILLAEGAATINAALEVGFYDQSHLHRHFKRRTGLSPAAYAEQEASLRSLHSLRA